MEKEIKIKNRFKITSLIRLWFVWLFGYKHFNFTLSSLSKEQYLMHNESIPYRKYYSLNSFLFWAKQGLVEKKFGEEKFLSMTMRQIRETKI